MFWLLFLRKANVILTMRKSKYNQKRAHLWWYFLFYEGSSRYVMSTREFRMLGRFNLIWTDIYERECGVVLVHNTQSNDSRSNGARLMHKLCLSLYTMNRQGRGKQLTSHQKLHWIIRIGLNSIFVRQKTDEITRYFIPTAPISFGCKSRLVCLEN